MDEKDKWDERDMQICDFELEVWSGLNNFLKNCKTFFGSRGKREENRIGRNVNRERRVSRPGMRTPVEARRGYVRASI